MLHIANPIYDSAFKYLMEDERIAKTLLSALIKRTIVEINMRPNEYANTTKDNISMFRIDFAARVREADGKEKQILIELQKTWVETETLRFRQYLGAQYANPANMKPGKKRQYGYPIITIYMMGHRVGDIDVPVLYVGRNYQDYDGKAVTRGIPDPFVDSLTHESIIVQIPLLKGQKNNNLERILDVFCQDRKDADNSQILTVSEEMMDDEDTRRIVTRLLSAASDNQVRHSMNIEEEIFTALENRDTEIMLYKKEASDAKKEASDAKKEASDAKKVINKQSEQLDKQSEQLDKQSEQLDKQSEQLNKQSEQLDKQSRQLQAAIRMLHSNGMDRGQIASALGISDKDVDSLLQSDT
jgi:hypothetical protein